jgi:N-acetylneuraminate synthase
MKPILVAECGINHNGDVLLAKKMIDIAVMAGCNYVKFQKRTIDDVYSPEELSAYRESPWGTTFRQQKEGIELSAEKYKEIDLYCKEKGIGWFASPWDIGSVDFLSEFDCPYIKVASACLGNMPLLRKIKNTNRPIIVSTGMVSKEELDAALNVLGENVKFILACTSTYPAKPEEMNMRKIETLKDCYGGIAKIGFSNHSPGILFVIMAATLGAEMIEYHITLDRSMYGSDQASSIELPGALKINDYVSDMEKCWGSGEIACAESEKNSRKKLWKSIT